jgi:hypothetical protein
MAGDSLFKEVCRISDISKSVIGKGKCEDPWKSIMEKSFTEAQRCGDPSSVSM